MTSLTLIIMMTFGFACLGAVIQKGASLQVKKDSIWFQEASALAHWLVGTKWLDGSSLVQWSSPHAITLRPSKPIKISSMD